MKQVMIEKRIPLLSADTLVKLSELGVQLGAGSGRVWLELNVDESVEKEVLRLVRAEGYSKVEAE